ncbi:hypothetical protein AAFF_G00345700 [Aldrovandia affinis]|uniref:Uncharacterized protein n=1 Tax=Aldrovandia affinis TaxID=143900 RepID=A0AAD7SKF9_9TELE|nr:hypothetical protein AAFF_G00345700 [Aldrovandia affinis]
MMQPAGGALGEEKQLHASLWPPLLCSDSLQRSQKSASLMKSRSPLLLRAPRTHWALRRRWSAGHLFHRAMRRAAQLRTPSARSGVVTEAVMAETE